MTKIKTLTLAAVLFSGLPFGCPHLKAQNPTTPVTIALGADAYGAASVPNASVRILVGDATRGGITVNLKPTNIIGQFTYAARGTAERTILKTSNVEFHAIGQMGIASSPNQVGMVISGGGGVTFLTSKLKGFQPTIDAEAEAFPASGNPTLSLSVWIGKTWSGQ